MSLKTQLYEATEQDNFDLVVTLVKRGDDVNVLSLTYPPFKLYESALHATLKHKTSKIMQYLIDNGANSNRIFTSEMYGISTGSVLAHAVAVGAHASLVECLLKAKADANQVVLANQFYDEPKLSILCLAVTLNHFEHAILLAQAGANVDCRLTDDWSLIHDAIYTADVQKVEFLIAACADINQLANIQFEEEEIAFYKTWVLQEQTRIHCMLLAYDAQISNKGGAKTALDISYRMMQRTAQWKDKSMQEIDDILQSEGCIEQERIVVQKECYRIIKSRAIEVCIAMQDLGLDANRMSYIVVEACAPFAYNLDFHYVWNLVVRVKHFREKDE